MISNPMANPTWLSEKPLLLLEHKIIDAFTQAQKKIEQLRMPRAATLELQTMIHIFTQETAEFVEGANNASCTELFKACVKLGVFAKGEKLVRKIEAFKKEFEGEDWWTEEWMKAVVDGLRSAPREVEKIVEGSVKEGESATQGAYNRLVGDIARLHEDFFGSVEKAEGGGSSNRGGESSGAAGA
jgi:hypothetical protein